MTLEKLQVIIEAYTKPYRDELEKVEKQTTTAASHVEKQTSRMRNSLKKVAGVMATVFSITAIVAFGKSCIQLGSQLAEVDNVIQQAMPSMTQQIDYFAKNAIEQFGMSEISAKRFTGVFASMARGFGYSEESAAAMSTTLTGLAADVASFYDTSQDVAFTKLKSVFTGETESLKDLGVVMSQTALDAYAMENGYNKTTKAMSEAEKVALRYAFVQDKLKFAQGDFARNSTSWANQVRILSERFNALKATIGQGLINAFTPVIQVINAILAKLQTLANYLKALSAALFGEAGDSGGGVSSVARTMSSAAGSSKSVADNMGKAASAAKKMKEYTLGIDELNVLSQDDDSGGSGGSGGGAAGEVPDFGNWNGELLGEVTINPKVEEMARKIKDALEAIKDAAQPAKESLKRLWDEGLSLLGNFVWTGLKDFYHEFLVPVGKWVLGSGLPQFLDITNEFLKAINWDKINTALNNFWKALAPFATNVGEGLLKFYRDLSEVGAAFINTVVPGGLNALSDALDSIDAEKAERIGYALGLIATAIIGLKTIGSVATGIKKLAEAIKLLPGVGLLSGLFGSGGLVAGLGNLAQGLGGPGTASFDVIVLKILELLNDASERLLPDWVKTFLGNLVSGLTVGAIGGSWIPGLGTAAGAIIGGIVGALNGIEIDGKSILKIIGDKIFNWDTAQSLYETAKESLTKAFSGEAKWYEIGGYIIKGIGAGITGAAALLLEPIGDLLDWVVEGICKVFGIHSPAESMKPYGGYILLGIVEGFRNTFNEWTKTLEEWFADYVTPWFTADKWVEVYKSVKDSLKTTWDNTVEQWGTGISNWWDSSVAPWFTAEQWSGLYETIKTQLKKKWSETVQKWISDLKLWWRTNVAPWFTVEQWSNLYETIKTQLAKRWGEALSEWKKNLSDWWEYDVSPWFTPEQWLKLYESIKQSLKDKWGETASEWKTNIEAWWKDDVEPWFTVEQWTKAMNKIPGVFKDIFLKAVNAAREQLNKLIDWLNDKLHISFDGFEILGEEIIPSFDFQLFTIPHIPAFATGGFPEDGLFLANHNELVGGFKGRTAVANNDQITEGIKQAVVEGMAEVLSRYSGNDENIIVETHVDMDGRTIVKQSDKVARRSGFNFRNPQPV